MSKHWHPFVADLSTYWQAQPAYLNSLLTENTHHSTQMIQMYREESLQILPDQIR
uniref:Uncharacterized protein n=1 Tax=Lepeophtheirus salmonis TaxID=72036 RepID=A0A0K2UDI2_LEPSM